MTLLTYLLGVFTGWMLVYQHYNVLRTKAFLAWQDETYRLLRMQDQVSRSRAPRVDEELRN